MSNKTSSLMYKMYALHYAQLFSDSTNEHSENEAHDWLLHYKLRGLSPRANYTDRAAAAGRRS